MKNTLQHTRNAELRKLYQDIISSKSINLKYLSRSAILNLIQEHPAPRFYITPKMAERYVLGYKRQDPAILCSRKLPMIIDLVETYERMVDRRKHSLRSDVWRSIVESPAKSFYMSLQRIEEIVFNFAERKKYDDQIK